MKETGPAPASHSFSEPKQDRGPISTRQTLRSTAGYKGKTTGTSSALSIETLMPLFVSASQLTEHSLKVLGHRC